MKERYGEILRFGDENEIIDAIYELSYIDETWAYDLIFEVVEKNKKGINSFVESIFLEKPNEYIATRLISLLGSDKIELRNFASKVLITIGAQFLNVLLDGLAYPEYDVRKFVVDIIGEIGVKDKRIKEKLIEMLDDDNEHVNVKFSILEVLAKLGDETVLPYIKKYIDSPDLGYIALYALGKISKNESKNILLKQLESDDILKKYAAIEVLGSMHDKDVRKILYNLLDKEGGYLNNIICKSIAMTLDKNETIEKGRKYFIEALDDDDCNIKETILRVLLRSPDDKVKDRLVALFDDHCGNVRELVFDFFSRKDVEILPRLFENVENFSNNGKINICNLIGKRNLLDREKLLIKFLENEDEEVRIAAAENFGHLSKVTLLDEFRKLMLTEDSIDVLRSMIISVGWHMDTKALPILIELSRKYENCELCDVISGSFILIGGSEAVNIIEENLKKNKDNEEVKLFAIMTLSRIGEEEILDILLEYLNDDNPEIRENVIYTLARIYAKEYIDKIVFYLSDEAANVREAALSALEMLNYEDILMCIENMTYDEENWLRYKAFKMLANYLPNEKIEDFLRKRYFEATVLDKLAILQILKNAQNIEIVRNIISESLKEKEREILLEAFSLIENFSLKEYEEELQKLIEKSGDLFLQKKAEETLLKLKG